MHAYESNTARWNRKKISFSMVWNNLLFNLASWGNWSDPGDLKSPEQKCSCEFESRWSYKIILEFNIGSGQVTTRRNGSLYPVLDTWHMHIMICNNLKLSLCFAIAMHSFYYTILILILFNIFINRDWLLLYLKCII